MIVVTHFAFYETWLEILHITHIFLNFLICFKRVDSVLSSADLHVDPPFYVVYALIE